MKKKNWYNKNKGKQLIIGDQSTPPKVAWLNEYYTISTSSNRPEAAPLILGNPLKVSLR
jgi:hypothetical protein